MALNAGVAARRIAMAERQAQALAHPFTTALDAHPIAARLSNQERAELVTLFAQQLALLEAAPPDVEAQGARSDSYVRVGRSRLRVPYTAWPDGGDGTSASAIAKGP